MKKKINTKQFKFNKALFELKLSVSNVLIQDYLNRIGLTKLTQEQSQKCEGVITKEEL